MKLVKRSKEKRELVRYLINILYPEYILRTKKICHHICTSVTLGRRQHASHRFHVNQLVEMLAVNCPVIQLFTHDDPYQSMLCVRSYTDFFFTCVMSCLHYVNRPCLISAILIY